MTDSKLLEELSDCVHRLRNGAMAVDLVRTGLGLYRVGSMPDVSKLEARFGLREHGVIVPEREVSQGGDSHTGEEFVQWRAQVFGSPLKPYIGRPNPLKSLYGNLAAVFPYYFDSRMLSIIKKRWLRKWVAPVPVDTVYEQGPLQVRFERGNILILDGGRRIYGREEFRPRREPAQIVEEALAEVRRDNSQRDRLEITVVGSGNGFFGTASSFVVRFGKHVLWVDPCAQPAHSLAKAGVHWDDITEVFISHNHEDHILGFSACLQRKRDRGERLRMITAPSIYAVLRGQFGNLFPGMAECIDLVEICPGRPVDLDGMRLITRWNHHFLPYGTLGLKIAAGGRTWGLSGDVKFDRRVNRVLNRDDLMEGWFRECDLLFHEVDFKNPKGVHSYWKEVERFQAVIKGLLFTYHTPPQENPPIPIAEEGRTYHLD
jgi:hypothetical protein